MRGVDKVYTTFTNNVAQGRNLPLEKVLDIAGGRVWSGDNALGIGLIDTYGGLKTAIAVAADKAGLGDNFRVTEVIEQPTGFAAFISSLNVSIREAMTRSELGVMMKEYKQVQEAASQQGIVMYYPFKLELRSSRPDAGTIKSGPFSRGRFLSLQGFKAGVSAKLSFVPEKGFVSPWPGLWPPDFPPPPNPARSAFHPACGLSPRPVSRRAK